MSRCLGFGRYLGFQFSAFGAVQFQPFEIEMLRDAKHPRPDSVDVIPYVCEKWYTSEKWAFLLVFANPAKCLADVAGELLKAPT
jgi:aminopeptidase-like protein